MWKAGMLNYYFYFLIMHKDIINIESWIDINYTLLNKNEKYYGWGKGTYSQNKDYSNIRNQR